MRLFTTRCLAALCAAFVASASSVLCGAEPAKTALPVVAPSEVGMDAATLERIDALVEEAIADGQTPGAVVAIGRGNKLAFLRAYGDRQTEPTVEKATVDTLYDLASVTKVASTAIGIAILVERGQLSYDDKIAKFFPEFAQNGKENVTTRDCLTHVSGLTPDNNISDYIGFNRDEIWANVCKLGLRSKPGEKFSYSDVGFITCGYLIEKISGVSQDEFLRENVYRPLGMLDAGYNPNAERQKRCAASEKRSPNDADWIKGAVHDPRAYEMDGVAGHAGLFATALDMAILGSTLAGRGTYVPASDPENPIQILKPETFAQMTAPQAVPRGIRSLGWDKRSPYSGNRGFSMSPSAFGHGGFTGTAFWVDPDFDLFVVFLANRLHPDGKGGVNSLAGKIGTIAVDSIRTRPDAAATKEFVAKSVYRSPNAGKSDVQGTLAGIDVLERDGYSLFKGRKVGLLTNQTGILRDGRRIPKAMQDAKVELTTLFSPEHGLYGVLDQSEIGDGKDSETGLPVYSLYGDVRRPTPEMLRDVDVFVFDIQDVGVRFYTYVSAMCSAMQAAADLGKSFVVLDRPNPIGGEVVSGPGLDAGRESYVAFFQTPIRHGATVGEIALLYANETRLNLDLTVVPCENWSRGQYFDETGLTWVNPSPNMRSLTEALLYPGIGIPEFTNISVGRGTETPFELIGAPWIDAEDLAAKMNAENLPGVEFEPVRFTPTASKYANVEVAGLRFKITDRDAFRAVETGVALMSRLKNDYPDKWERKNANTLLLNDETLEAIEAGKPISEIAPLWMPEIERFKKIRADYLIY